MTDFKEFAKADPGSLDYFAFRLLAEENYHRTGNPLYAWRVVQQAKKRGEHPPGWADVVVMSAMDRLFDQPQGDSNDILKALGLLAPKGQRSYARQYRDDQNAVKALTKAKKSSTDFERAKRGRLLLSNVLVATPPWANDAIRAGSDKRD